MLCGCIDIGSNTTRLLVADVGTGALREILAHKAFTRLGRAAAGEAPVPADKVREVAEVAGAQARAAREVGVERLRAVATAAIRRAVNREELLEAVRAATGLDVDVLSGEEEARLAFLGATASLPAPPAGPVAVVDVGGGSCEVAVGEVGAGVGWSTSLPVGSGTLTEAHLRSDPPSGDELAALRAGAARAFAGLAPPPAQLAVAVGGSATSLCRLAGPSLDERTLGDALHALCSDRAAAVARRFALDVERARLLPAGMALLEQAARAFAQPLEVVGGGLREGVVLDEACR